MSSSIRSIAALFEGKTPERSHPIPFTMKGTALIDGNLKLLKVGRGKGAKWALYDLHKDPGEKKDISSDHPEIFENLMGLYEKNLRTKLMLENPQWVCS